MGTVAANNNFVFTSKHISGLNNDIADSLSQFQEIRFRSLAPHAQKHPADYEEIKEFLQP